MQPVFLSNYTKFLALIAGLILVSCEQVRNSVQDITLQCGADVFEKIDSRNFVKVLSEENLPLSPQELKNVRARNLSDETGHTVDLSISTKGCIEIPKEFKSDTVAIQVKDSRLAAIASIGKNEIQVTKVQLKSIPRLNLEVNCESEIIYAVDELVNPIIGLDSFDEKLLSYQLEASEVASGLNFSLFTKPLGQTTQSMLGGSALDLKHLSEGIYDLRVSIAEIPVDLALKFVPLQREKQCKLVVLRHPPKIVDGIFEKPGFFALKKYSQWPVRKEFLRSDYKLLACQKDSTGMNENLCSKKSSDCQFVDLNQLKTDNSGIFTLFYKILDGAGNQSEEFCQEIAIIEESPLVEVYWPENKWNQPGAYLERPQSFFAPKVYIRDTQVLSTKRINEMLECRVEFSMPSGYIIKGNDAECVSGRCKGLSLEEYVPCDDEFSFSLGRAWSNAYINNSQLKIFVKVDDGTGKVQEIVRTLGISDNRWKLNDITTPFGSEANIEEYLKLDEQSYVFVVKDLGPYLYKVAENSWQSIMPVYLNEQGLKLSKSRILKDRDGILFGSFATEKGISFARWNEGSWIEIGTLDSAVACQGFVSLEKSGNSGLLCLAQEKNERGSLKYKGLVAVDRDRVEILITPGLEKYLEKVTGIKDPLSIALDGSILVINREIVYSAPNIRGQWSQALNISQSFQFSFAQVLTSQNQYWILSSSLSDRKVVRMEWRDGKLISEEIQVPQFPIKYTTSERLLSRNQKGDIYYCSYRYDLESKRWVLDQNIQNDLVNLEAKQDLDFNNVGWFRTESAFAGEDFWPTSVYGVEPVYPIAKNGNDSFLFIGKRRGIDQMRLYKFELNSFYVLNEERSSLIRETFPKVWSDEKGRLITQDIRKGLVIVYENGKWNSLSKMPNNSAKDFKEKYLPLSNGGLAVILGFGIHIKYDHQSEWNDVILGGDSAQLIFPNATNQDKISPDWLRSLQWIGADADKNLYMYESRFARIIVIQKNGTIKSESLQKFGDAKEVLNSQSGPVLILKSNKILRFNSNLMVVDESIDLTENIESIKNQYLLDNKFLKFFKLFQIEGVTSKISLCAAFGPSDSEEKYTSIICTELSESFKNGKIWELKTPSEASSNFITDLSESKFQIGQNQNRKAIIWYGNLYISDGDEEFRLALSLKEISNGLGVIPILESFHVDRFGRVLLAYRNAGIVVFE